MTHSFPTRRSSYLVRIHLREKFLCARFAAHDVVLAPLDPDIEQRGDQLDLVAIAAARVLVKNGYLSHLPPPARSCRPVRPLPSAHAPMLHRPAESCGRSPGAIRPKRTAAMRFRRSRRPAPP